MSAQRWIVLDTETTGLDPKQGHRVIEIGCVELVNRRPTGNNFWHYLQPDRVIDDGAIEVHGITNEMLADKPRFAEISDELSDYLRGAELVIHNAAFDVGFLDNEFELLNSQQPQLADICTITDSLDLARRMHPGQKNNLNALCRRYEIDNSRREFHGALLDAQLLADVYLLMTGGQSGLNLDADSDAAGQPAVRRLFPGTSGKPRRYWAGEAARQPHDKLFAQFADKLGDQAPGWPGTPDGDGQVNP